MSALERFFQIKSRNSTVAREVRGGIATFLTMAYILFVNPDILSAAGVPKDAAIAGTALAAGLCCLLMGFVANFPLAMASGMGLNAVVAFQVAKLPGADWHAAMGVIVLDGMITLLLVLGGFREAVMHAIPRPLRLATGAGIGLFIAFIGLANARIALATGLQDAPVTYGSWHDPQTALAVGGLLVTAVLLAKKIPGAIVLGILATTIAGFLTGHARWPSTFAAPSLATAFHANLPAALKLPGIVPVLFSVVMVDFFDTIGTATAIAEQAKLFDKSGRVINIRRVLAIDSVGAIVGGTLGVSSVTGYIESATGVAEGARTGLHTVVVGLLFLACIVLAPIAAVIPGYATAPALILVGFLMLGQIASIDFDDLETAIPAFLIVLTIPLTYSIAHGIGYGFLAFVAIKLLGGKFTHVHPLMYLVAAAFAAYFVWSI